MNTNLIKAVLSAKFPQLGDKSLTGLAEVCNATGNAEAAIESILGVYQEPVLPQQSNRHNTLYTFKSFKKFSNTVEATYEEPKMAQLTHNYPSKEEAQQAIKDGSFAKGTLHNDYLQLNEVYQRVKDIELDSWMQYAI